MLRHMEEVITKAIRHKSARIPSTSSSLLGLIGHPSLRL